MFESGCILFSSVIQLNTRMAYAVDHNYFEALIIIYWELIEKPINDCCQQSFLLRLNIVFKRQLHFYENIIKSIRFMKNNLFQCSEVYAAVREAAAGAKILVWHISCRC